MATAEALAPTAELLDSLGGIPAERVRMVPYPGTATEADVLELLSHSDHLYELIDGTIVEKTVGARESRLAFIVGRRIDEFNDSHNLGHVLGSDGMVRLWTGRLRSPDAAFYSWDRLPDEGLPNDRLTTMFPDLAIEVLSPSNTAREMAIKRRDYFRSGTRIVWEFEPELRNVAVFTKADAPDAILHADDTLTAGDVLPGFALPLADVFAALDRRRP